MTDNEIVKALGACLHRGCNVCIRRPEEYGATERQCLRGLMKDTLDLINRQKDEIERLENRNGILVNRVSRREEKIKNLQSENERLNKFALIRTFDRFEKQTKAEAYKEFAERLNKEAEKVEIDREGDFVEAENKIYDTVAIWCKATSDNILKELVGEDDGKL